MYIHNFCCHTEPAGDNILTEQLPRFHLRFYSCISCVWLVIQACSQNQVTWSCIEQLVLFKASVKSEAPVLVEIKPWKAIYKYDIVANVLKCRYFYIGNHPGFFLAASSQIKVPTLLLM